MNITAVLPAHNEAHNIAAAVRSVRHQVNKVLVVADNCTDNTAELARQAGADVYVTRGNTDRKAGALNQALTHLLPTFDGYLLIMDADSTIGPRFVGTAAASLGRDPTLGAVGGIFYGNRPRNLIEQAQANEYTRYSRRIAQKRGHVSVLTGTAAMFRRDAVQQLLDTRGFIYDPAAITEDNEITLALKTLGWHLRSPQPCTVRTELMSSFQALRVQRLRWYRGALDNLVSYGWTSVTRRYWLQQIGLALSTLAMLSYLTVTIWGAAIGRIHFSWFWTVVGIGFIIERLITVWGAGWRGRIFAALLLPEMIYDVFLQACFIQAVYTKVTHRNVRWEHSNTKEIQTCTEPVQASQVAP